MSSNVFLSRKIILITDTFGRHKIAKKNSITLFHFVTKKKYEKKIDFTHVCLARKKKQIHIESSKLNRLLINIINKSCDSSVWHVWHPPDPLHNICTIDSARNSATSNSHCLLPATAFYSFWKKSIGYRSYSNQLLSGLKNEWMGHRKATTLILRQFNSAVYWLISFRPLTTAHKTAYKPHTTAFVNIVNPGPNGKHEYYAKDTNTA